MNIEITAQELSVLLAQQASSPVMLLDVREPWEWDLAKIPGSVHIPMHLIPLRHNELPDDSLIVVICHHGVRSLQVAHYLRDIGFEQMVSLSGGIDSWSANIANAIPRY
jgi:rhodanese-related sulfurtransferase